MSTATTTVYTHWYEPTSAATTSDVFYYHSQGDFTNDDNGENLYLFMAPVVILKKDKKPSKWLQKVIKNRGLR